MGDETIEVQKDQAEESVLPPKAQSAADADEEDDEDENDEDYKPEEDPDAQGDEDDDDMQVDGGETSDLGAPLLDHHKRKAVDLAFERLFGYEWGTEFALDEESLASPGVRQLVSIFGSTVTARILASPAASSVGEASKRRRITTAAAIVSATSATENAPSATPLIVLPVAPIVMETKVFAGQAIQVPKRMPPATTATAAASKSSSNLDSVLAQLAGPSKLSTVQKTSEDWEQFKQTDKQLQEELERKAQSKDAFLVKQDFLNRVDQRQFELEREVRDRERAKRGK
jgi:hypothetical protein